MSIHAATEPFSYPDGKAEVNRNDRMALHASVPPPTLTLIGKVNASVTDSTCWIVSLFNSPSELLESSLQAGCALRLHHREANGYLCAVSRPEVHLYISDPSNDSAGRGAASLWEIEMCKAATDLEPSCNPNPNSGPG